MKNKEQILNFYKGKRVLVTGHTGFKGSWLVQLLLMAGAEVTGYSLEALTESSVLKLAGLEHEIKPIIGDVRDFKHLKQVFAEVQPEIVLHLAAQPIVRESYRLPRYTYETNVMGTVNICECVHITESVRSFLNVTTDKVYHNNEWCWGYRENEPLDGFDPYSNSKSCSELVTHSYVNSFFNDGRVAVSTARAGNVIGGGDFSTDRIIPDCVRAVQAGVPVIIRNPDSTRPYQHVLEPLFMYLTIAAEQYDHPEKAGWYNVGPDDCDCVTTGKLVELFASAWGDGFQSEVQRDLNAPHESNFLKLDTSLLKNTFDWKPTWHIDEAIDRTVEWTKVWLTDGSAACINRTMEQQIESFVKVSQ